MNKCMYYEVLKKNMNSEQDIDISTSIFGLTPNAFWKRALQIYWVQDV